MTPVCLIPGRLWSLWDVLRIYAERFVESSRLLSSVSFALKDFEDGKPISKAGTGYAKFREHLEKLRVECEQLDCRLTIKHINRVLGLETLEAQSLRQLVDEIVYRYRDELASRVCFALSPDRASMYAKPLDKWDRVIERFGCSFDIEEARKCFALERYTASVFHMMKVLEAAVLELQVFLGKEDARAHFGSVITKLADFTQKNKHADLPLHLQPYYQFMRETLTQLHAVKDSWRNKVTHVDALIVPSETFTEEMAKGVHDATLLLMDKLVDGLPPRANASSSSTASPVSQSPP